MIGDTKLDTDSDFNQKYGAYLAVVLRTYSSMLSISGLMVEIIVAKPAA